MATAVDKSPAITSKDSGDSPSTGKVLLSTLPYLLAYTAFPVTIVAAVKGGLWVIAPFFLVLAAMDFVVGDNQHNPSTRVSRSQLLLGDILTWLWIPLLLVTYIIVYNRILYSDHLSVLEIALVLHSVGGCTSLGLGVGHDLSHRRHKWEKYLSEFLMSFAGLGYYSTEHVYVHHAHVATPRDPVTARKGESVYRFIARAWIGSIITSWRADRERLRRRGLTMVHPANPWWRYLAVFLIIASIYWTAASLSPYGYSGIDGLILYFSVIFVANVNLRGIDYIEHYGLLRTYIGKGRFERPQPRHSWNSAKRISSYIMFNVQRHSDHHYKPTRHYLLLQTYNEDNAPQMPSNYIVMFLIAFVPPLWRRLMHPRLDTWRRRFYPHIEDWAAYESRLFFKYPEKYPVIAEVMAKDKRLSDWMHKYPAVLEGKHAPEEAHLWSLDMSSEDEWEQIASRGLVAVFYQKELTPQEISEQLADLTQIAADVDDTVTIMRPWLEDRSFQLGLHILRGNLEPEVAGDAFTKIVEGVVLHLAEAVDREFDAEFNEPSVLDAPSVIALGALARRELQLGEVVNLSVEAGSKEGYIRSGIELEQFQKKWEKLFLRGLKRLFTSDFPCRFAGTLTTQSADERTVAGQPDRRELRL